VVSSVDHVETENIGSLLPVARLLKRLSDVTSEVVGYAAMLENNFC
jgi:hypothetical protein